MIFETKKLLNKDIKVTATCVRVPVTYGHSVSVNVETYNKIDLKQLAKAMNQVDGLIHHDMDYPTVKEYRHEDQIHVGRLRLDPSVENGLNLWIVADNIRKGAATNTIQIAEYMIKEKLR
jgi:aspartate-semialdehyde dehydrogenase